MNKSKKPKLENESERTDCKEIDLIQIDLRKED